VHACNAQAEESGWGGVGGEGIGGMGRRIDVL